MQLFEDFCLSDGEKPLNGMSVFFVGIGGVSMSALARLSRMLGAVVSVTFDDCLAVHDIKVIYARDRYFIVMPSRKNPDGTYRDIVHPINTAFRTELERTVIDAYNAQLIAVEHDEPEAEKEHEVAVTL